MFICKCFLLVQDHGSNKDCWCTAPILEDEVLLVLLRQVERVFSYWHKMKFSRIDIYCDWCTSHTVCWIYSFTWCERVLHALFFFSFLLIGIFRRNYEWVKLWLSLKWLEEYISVFARAYRVVDRRAILGKQLFDQHNDKFHLLVIWRNLQSCSNWWTVWPVCNATQLRFQNLKWQSLWFTIANMMRPFQFDPMTEIFCGVGSAHNRATFLTTNSLKRVLMNLKLWYGVHGQNLKCSGFQGIHSCVCLSFYA